MSTINNNTLVIILRSFLIASDYASDTMNLTTSDDEYSDAVPVA